MYSHEERLKAVKLHVDSGMGLKGIMRTLGYPHEDVYKRQGIHRQYLALDGRNVALALLDNLRFKGHLHLTAAFRSLSRPSSADIAKACLLYTSVPEQRSSSQGKSGPKPRHRRIGDGQQVAIPVPDGVI